MSAYDDDKLFFFEYRRLVLDAFPAFLDDVERSQKIYHAHGENRKTLVDWNEKLSAFLETLPHK